jgi:arylsulfatase B
MKQRIALWPHVDAKKRLSLRARLLVCFFMLFAGAQAHAAQYPEDGWWYSPAQSGRGFLIERQGNTMFIGAFIYAANGRPEWLVMQGSYNPSAAVAGQIGDVALSSFSTVNGQCIGCAFVAPTLSASTQNPALITFTSNQTATLVWPGETINLQRQYWAWRDSVDQLDGNWMVTSVSDGLPSAQIVKITANTNATARTASIVTLSTGAAVGSLALANGALSLRLSGSAQVLPVLAPEATRFYAGSSSANAMQVVGVRLDDTPFATATAIQAGPPNILFIIADDFGLDASPCHPSIGALKPLMPNLSGLCQRGLVFDSAWAHPTCTPTRASILSGSYGIHSNVMAVDEVLSNTDTLLSRLQQGSNPYSVAVVGKWHVSGNNAAANIPASFGAAHFAGFLTGALTDYSNWRITVNGVASSTSNYATTELTDRAMSWMSTQQQPWFLWLAYNAPHTPFHTPPANLYTQAGLKNGTATDNRTKYFAAAEALDAELGRLIASIPAATLANTTIVFMGDNGTPGQVIQTPYTSSRAKDSLYQGGINVPLVFAGAGVTRSGQREAALVNATDLFATFSALTQRSQAVSNDSISFANALQAANVASRTHAYIDFRDAGTFITAIRDSRYKLIELASARRELYDLTLDPFETTNLIATSISPAQDLIIQSLLIKRAQFQQ